MSIAIENLEDLCNYISRNAERIPVIAQKDGKWGSYFLTELPVNDAIKEALRFVAEGRIPVVMKK